MNGAAIITFDVSGKIYKSSESVFDKHPDSVLSMLVRHHLKKEEPLFLNRDQKMFRWILNFYQSDVLVDHTTVGVPAEVWDVEVDFFGLLNLCEKQENDVVKPDIQVFGEMVEEKRQKRKRDNEDEFERLCAARIEKLRSLKDTECQKRRKLFEKLLTFLMNRVNTEGLTGWNLIEPDERNLDQWSWQYPEEIREIPLSLLSKYKIEIKEFAKEFGFDLEIGAFRESCTSKTHQFTPASKEHFRYKHRCLEITMKPNY